MKVTYSTKTDTLRIQLTTRTIEHTEEAVAGDDSVLVDYDANEEVVGFEILDASQHFAAIPWVKAPAEAAA